MAVHLSHRAIENATVAHWVSVQEALRVQSMISSSDMIPTVTGSKLRVGLNMHPSDGEP